MLISLTTLIWIFKKEKDHRLENNYIQLSIIQNYKLFWDILKLPNIRILLIALVTMTVNIIQINIIRNKNMNNLHQYC